MAEKNAEREDFRGANHLRVERSKSEWAALTSSFDMNKSDGKASLKRQKSPETMTDTQDVSKFYRFNV